MIQVQMWMKSLTLGNIVIAAEAISLKHTYLKSVSNVRKHFTSECTLLGSGVKLGIS